MLPRLLGRTSDRFKKFDGNRDTKKRKKTGFRALAPTRPGLKRNRREEEAEEASVVASLSRGLAERKSHLCEGKKFVLMRVGHCVRKGGGRKKKQRHSPRKALIQRASVRNHRLSITPDSQGPFRAPVNHGPALPAHEARGRPGQAHR